MKTSYLSLGSNIHPRLEHINQALRQLARAGKVTAQSKIYETEPLGPPGQDWHLNMVIEFATKLPPAELLLEILGIEQKIGRQKRGKWGPREIDIDILLYNSLALDTVVPARDSAGNAPGLRLQIPHPEMKNRKFILVPLCDIAAGITDPLTGKPFAQLLRECPDKLQVKARQEKK